MLVINSEQIAQELLDKRSQNYSDRPQVLMVELWDRRFLPCLSVDGNCIATGWIGVSMWGLSRMVLHVSSPTAHNVYVLIMRSANVGRKLVDCPWISSSRLIMLASCRHRKAMHQALNPQAMISYQGLQLSKVHQMIRNIIAVPQEMEAHLRTWVSSHLAISSLKIYDSRFTASTIMQVVYGYEMAPRNDLFASIADRASEMLTNSFFPGAALVNTFPICMSFPFSEYEQLICCAWSSIPAGMVSRSRVQKVSLYRW